ncbi:hypothetical protein GQ600_23550 [Phytophthora cactorum]|nr:hypothetical protein GQ600_23550 [Phytophthora cactorum]
MQKRRARSSHPGGVRVMSAPDSDTTRTVYSTAGLKPAAIRSCISSSNSDGDDAPHRTHCPPVRSPASAPRRASRKLTQSKCTLLEELQLYKCGPHEFNVEHLT